jgi:hypothetical protein
LRGNDAVMGQLLTRREEDAQGAIRNEIAAKK